MTSEQIGAQQKLAATLVDVFTAARDNGGDYQERRPLDGPPFDKLRDEYDCDVSVRVSTNLDVPVLDVEVRGSAVYIGPFQNHYAINDAAFIVMQEIRRAVGHAALNELYDAASGCVTVLTYDKDDITTASHVFDDVISSVELVKFIWGRCAHWCRIELEKAEDGGYTIFGVGPGSLYRRKLGSVVYIRMTKFQL